MSVRRSKRLESISSTKENIEIKSPMTPKMRNLTINSEKKRRSSLKRISVNESIDVIPSAKKKSPEDKSTSKQSTTPRRTRRNLFNSTADESQPVKTPSTSTQSTTHVKGDDDSNEPEKILKSPILSPRKAYLALPTGEVRQSPRKTAVSYLTPQQLAKQQSICYKSAKDVLNTKVPNKLISRRKEFNELKEFVKDALKTSQPGSFYVSGSPGTGKTAVISLLMSELRDEGSEVVYINCMSFGRNADFYQHLYEELTSKSCTKNTKDRLVEIITKKKKNCFLLVLDEIDQLSSVKQEDLYAIFEWPFLENSRLILIGIANSLDLTDRILPRLKAIPNAQPKLLNFAPYSKDQIVEIVSERLSEASVNGESVFEPAAVEYCAKKVATVTGDIRKALNICKRAVEIVESQVRHDILAQPPMLIGSPLKRPSANIPKKVNIPVMMNIISEVYGGKQEKKSGMLLYHKLVICSFVQLLKTGVSKEVSLGKVYDNYVKICKKGKFTAVSQSEFASMCTLLESRGMFLLKKGKETRSTKISLKTDVEELIELLQDEALSSLLLQMKI